MVGEQIAMTDKSKPEEPYREPNNPPEQQLPPEIGDEPNSLKSGPPAAGVRQPAP
jgi:hypothetical protein